MIPLREIGEKLIALQVVNEAQWQTAAAGEPELPQVLDRLEQMPGAWFDPDNADSRALNDSQRDHIFAAVRRGDLDRLDRKLRLGRFLILRTLGRGGMGVVLLAWDVAKSRYVALKRLHGGSPQKRRRFRREARISSRLNHPSICRSLGFHRVGKTAALVMEYIPGRSLKAEVVMRHAPIPWQEVAQWSVEVLEGLAHAHGRGVIHRDIKPENILLTPVGRGLRAKVLDMGLAKLKGGTETPSADDLTAAGQLVGTPAYMAPEQWKGSNDSVPESDIYALGGTLFYTLTGRTPFRADNAVEYCTVHSQERPPRVMEFPADVRPKLDELIARMLAKQPRQRGSALELLWDFRRLIGSPDGGATAARGVGAVRAPDPKLKPSDPTLAVTALSAGRVREAPSSAAEPPPAESPVTVGPLLVLGESAEGGEGTMVSFYRPTRLKFQNRTIARLLPVPGRWSLYPTGMEPLVWHNRHTVRGRCRLSIGDVVHLENREWNVEDLVAMPAEGWVNPAEVPSIEVCFGNREVARGPARAETLIGTAEWCDLRLPAGLGLPLHWAVLAKTNRGWELFALGEDAFSRDGQNLGTEIQFEGPDEIVQGDVRLVFRPGAAPADRSGTLSDTGSLYGAVEAGSVRDTPFYRRCERVCQKAMEGLRSDATPVKPTGTSFGLKRFLKRLAWPKEPAEELHSFELDLQQAPHDTALLRKLGEFFDRFGFDNLRGRLLIELYKREPHDAQLLLDLAEVYSRRALQTDRPQAARIHSATEAYACLQQASKLRPNDHEIRARLKNAAGQMALLKGGFGGG